MLIINPEQLQQIECDIIIVVYFEISVFGEVNLVLLLINGCFCVMHVVNGVYVTLDLATV